MDTTTTIEAGRSAASMIDRIPPGEITERGRAALVRTIETIITRWCMAGDGDGTREHRVYRVPSLPFEATMTVRVTPGGSYYAILDTEITASGAEAWRRILEEECRRWRLAG